MTWAHYTGRQVPTFYFSSFLHGHQSVLKTSAAAVLVTRTPLWKSLLMEGTSKAASVRLLSEMKGVENGEREKETSQNNCSFSNTFLRLAILQNMKRKSREVPVELASIEEHCTEGRCPERPHVC